MPNLFEMLMDPDMRTALLGTAGVSGLGAGALGAGVGFNQGKIEAEKTTAKNLQESLLEMIQRKKPAEPKLAAHGFHEILQEMLQGQAPGMDNLPQDVAQAAPDAVAPAAEALGLPEQAPDVGAQIKAMLDELAMKAQGHEGEIAGAGAGVAGLGAGGLAAKMMARRAAAPKIASSYFGKVARAVLTMKLADDAVMQAMEQAKGEQAEGMPSPTGEMEGAGEAEQHIPPEAIMQLLEQVPALKHIIEELVMKQQMGGATQMGQPAPGQNPEGGPSPEELLQQIMSGQGSGETGDASDKEEEQTENEPTNPAQKEAALELAQFVSSLG